MEDEKTSEITGSLTRKRRSTRRRRDEPVLSFEGVKPLTYDLDPVEILKSEDIETIHKASMRLLSETGMLLIDHPPALENLKANGVKVEGEMAWIDEDTLMHFVNMAPRTFTQLARNPLNNLTVGGNQIIFAPVYGPAFAFDLDKGRRPATLEDFHNFAKLTYMTPELHHAGGVLVEPNDVDLGERHLDMLLAHITLNDKAYMGNVIHPDNARDTVTMSEIIFGAEAIRENPAALSIVSISSPMRMDERMLSALEVYAEAKQAMILAPFIIVGAMSPSTIAASIAQQNAESLFAIAYAQMLNPGTPCIQGPFLPNVDMKTGAPAFGSPESNLALYACAQMARHYGLPFRSGGNYTASRVPDGQAGYESAGTVWPTVQACTNFILHAAGWQEGGLTSGYEKFILDIETLGALTKFSKGLDLSEEEFAWDAYEEAGPGNHFLGTAHTMRHYKDAFFQPKVFHTDSYEKWKDEGSTDAGQRANLVWKEMLYNYEPPALDEAIAEELDAFVTQRRQEIQGGKARSEWVASKSSS